MRSKRMSVLALSFALALCAHSAGPAAAEEGVLDKAREATQGAYDATKEGAGKAWDATKDGTQNTYDKAKEGVTGEE